MSAVSKQFIRTAAVGAIIASLAAPVMAADRDPGCSGGTCPTTGGDITNNNNSSASSNSSATQKVKNNFMALNMGAAAAAVGNGCTAVKGFNVGAGFAGIGAGVSFSNVDEEFFVKCTHYSQLETIFKAAGANCATKQLGIMAMATSAGDMAGNPALQALLNTGRGQQMFTGICTGNGVTFQPVAKDAHYKAPKPRG